MTFVIFSISLKKMYLIACIKVQTNIPYSNVQKVEGHIIGIIKR